MTRNMVIFVPLKLPINRHFALGRQQSIGLREMAAAEEGATSQRRRVGGLQDMVARPVDQSALAARKIAPKKEHDTVAIV